MNAIRTRKSKIAINCKVCGNIFGVYPDEANTECLCSKCYNKLRAKEEKRYEIAKQYLIKKYSGDYVDFIETEGQAYLDGLAEGKPKWHDLRKDPNDLPTETGHYLTDDGEYIYDVDCKKWRTLRCRVCWDFDWLDDGEIIAWCELPKFEG